jgi:hypothetical protein
MGMFITRSNGRNIMLLSQSASSNALSEMESLAPSCSTTSESA